jgi:hypothetical protein
MKISHQSEIRKHFHALTKQDPDLAWQWTASVIGPEEDLSLGFDGKEIAYDPIYELSPGNTWLEKAPGPNKPGSLLVVPELKDRVLEQCKNLGISAMDLNGRAWLRAEGFWFERPPLPGRAFRYELEPRNIFVGKSERIVRSLLTDRSREWRQSELVARSQASSGLVSRIVNYLCNMGYAEKTGTRVFRAKDLHALLDAWAKADTFATRAKTTRYTGLSVDPFRTMGVLQEWAGKAQVRLAFTQWVAAWHRKPYTEPVVCSAYVSRLPIHEELETLGLREVGEAGKVWLHVPEDEGVFLETQQVGSFQAVTDAQVYIDLQGTPLRGPDAAKALREWEGFCHP